MERNSLGGRINITRKELGITSEKLSELCNINATYLRQIESGRKVPSLAVFISLCQKLNVTPTYLLQDSLNGTENGDIDALVELIRSATPNQIKLITAVFKSAVDILDEK